MHNYYQTRELTVGAESGGTLIAAAAELGFTVGFGGNAEMHPDDIGRDGEIWSEDQIFNRQLLNSFIYGTTVGGVSLKPI